jgi:hypothetical protein
MYNGIMIILYIDPGSGSLFFQALISGFLTFIVFYKKIITFIKDKIKIIIKKDSSK